MLDPAQYHMDVKDGGAVAEYGTAPVYAGMNLLVRRRSKENNFKVRFHKKVEVLSRMDPWLSIQRTWGV